ncbi:MAG: Crp/Fnr family transcriptional regulator [Chitinophagales bacterium]|nr:Crp/Fnr family transcriptional regulator [Chitinophagales bacterium]
MKNEILVEKIKCSYIRKHTLFKNIPEDEFSEICAKARLVKVSRKTPLLLNSDPVSRVYFVGNGTAKQVYYGKGGHNHVTDILVNGDIFGDFTFSGFNAQGYVKGLKPNTFIFYFIASHFKKMLQQNHNLSLNFAENISSKLRYLEERHFVWTNKDARQRLLYFFKGWSACDGIRTGDKIILENYFSLGDIADFIGVSRQFIHTIVKELKEEGQVYYSRNKILIAEGFLNPAIPHRKQAV